MEVVLLVIMGLVFALGFLIEKATEFLKQFKSCDTSKLGNGFEAKLSVVPVEKKSEESASNTFSTKNDTSR